MKRLLYILICASLVLSCAKDELFPQLETYTLTGFANSDNITKTYFGTPNQDSETIPFLWSEGDQIYSAGKKSTNTAITPDGTSAQFTFAQQPEDGKYVYYNMSGSSEKVAYVKPNQDISNSLGLNGDFGYGLVNGGSFNLEHATAYLWFDPILFEGATLESVTLDAGDIQIAGNAPWDENSQKLGAINNGYESVTKISLTNSNQSDNMWTMVIYPLDFTGKTLKVIYKIKVSENYFEYHHLNLNGIELQPGTTYKILQTIAESNAVSTDDYTITKTLTFEDDDAQFSEYSLDYVDMWAGKLIGTWSDLIDDPQYMGPLTYGMCFEAEYNWHDEGNTELCHYFPVNNGAYCYWGGGHAISNYWGEGYSNEDRNKHIAKYYSEEYVENNAGNDSALGWFNVQLMVPQKPHSGENFAVHYGYKDFFTYIENLPEWTFYDGIERVIDHMYVINTNYTLNQLVNGVMSEAGNTFGGSWTGLNDNAWLRITAQGFEKEYDEDPVREVHFYLVKGNQVIEEWTKWDMSQLGIVGKVRFNFEYSADMGGKYGFTIPGYFSYDDVAVRSK